MSTDTRTVVLTPSQGLQSVEPPATCRKMVCLGGDRDVVTYWVVDSQKTLTCYGVSYGTGSVAVDNVPLDVAAEADSICQNQSFELAIAYLIKMGYREHYVIPLAKIETPQMGRLKFP